ncbi:DUF3472 domain-containing protein [Sediminibacterium soli]|uniref:DUF3472 domain-containing protein n=1 Tax=Sediminibacterium soli TaxID=2698829 RepID=UPI00137A01AC|nr:DUF3472 domain-containing protein [Sediminibacterium soli]NCI46530.1 DUF5077 domain-containing protein [Sediminibacterium soli]
MKQRVTIATIACLLAAVFSCTCLQAQETVVPAGGNSWVTGLSARAKEKVTNEGWRNWQTAAAVWNTYLRPAKPGSLRLAVLLSVPAGESSIAFTINGKTNAVKADKAGMHRYDIGEWDIAAPGYVMISAQGLGKTGGVYAEVKEFYISGSAVDSNTAFVRNNEGNYFYWGRRGPSVHINYDISGISDIEWFYNEITVPAGNDVIGSYFMADGFAEGYFGMQVNSERERRIIFSVWSSFRTDNPKEIPEDQKIVLVKKGRRVTANEFGNEGSGGHSHLVYPWKAGQRYGFLLHGTPLPDNRTQYTAYFQDPDKKEWLLIASFIRPATNTWLKRLHSFLENFIPETGNLTRRAYYHNQWVKPRNSDWQPLRTMYLTADATAGKKYRMDYGGGLSNGRYYLANGGFFNETAVLRQPVTVVRTDTMPDIDLGKLNTLLHP